MIDIRRIQRTLLETMSVACLLACPAMVKADTNAATSALKACLIKHLPDERKKSNPNSENLLNVCKQELSVVMSMLPPGTEIDVRLFIKSDIENELNK